MNVTDDGGRAFPVPNDANVNGQEGMTLRDYFAAAVISPMLVEAYGTTPGILATKAFLIADAMLKARAQPND